MPSNPFNNNGAGGDRTRDLLNAIQARSQLRHSPNFDIFLTHVLERIDINAYTASVKDKSLSHFPAIALPDILYII